MNEQPTRDEAIAALKSVLAELPMEFSDGPPGGHTRPEFRVLGHNVERVHAGLWALQQYFAAAAENDERLARLVADLEAEYGPVGEADTARFLQALVRAAPVIGDSPTVYVLTEQGGFVSAHRTREAALAAQAALLDQRQVPSADNGFELAQHMPAEGHRSQITKVEVKS